MKRTIIIVVVVVLVGLIAFRLISNKKHIESKKQVVDNSNVRVAVNTAKVENKTTDRSLTLVGTVAANQVIDVKSEVAGKITSLNFKLGDFVSKGKALGHIDNTIRELSVQNAEQSLADAKQNFERYKNLYEGGGATKAQFDQYSLAYNNAKIQFQQSKKQMSDAVISAPISGYVTVKAVEAGAFVNVGSPVATVADVSSLKVQLNVSEKDIYSMKVGDQVKISATVYPGIDFQGKISFISVTGDEAHNYPVEISIKNDAKNPLKAGTYVDISFGQKGKVTALQIPREALMGSLKDGKVYVVDTSTKLARIRNVVIGLDNGSSLEVLKGLKEGENVITSGQINLADSMKVNIIK